jgi:nitroreductase
MDLFDAIHTRRSIRKFTGEPVEDALIEKGLRAAMMAPSAGNAQPWEFVVIRDRALLERIPAIHPHAAMAPQAAAAIMVCAATDREKYPGNFPADCATATQNLLLALHGSGLGAVWCGVYPREERMHPMRALVGLPDGVVPYALIPLGWPAEEKADTERFESERVHQDRW